MLLPLLFSEHVFRKGGFPMGVRWKPSIKVEFDFVNPAHKERWEALVATFRENVEKLAEGLKTLKTLEEQRQTERDRLIAERNEARGNLDTFIKEEQVEDEAEVEEDRLHAEIVASFDARKAEYEARIAELQANQADPEDKARLEEVVDAFADFLATRPTDPSPEPSGPTE
jgi:hypothetical protein